MARESKPERDSFEMMLNLETNLVMQKAGRKIFWMWEIITVKN